MPQTLSQALPKPLTSHSQGLGPAGLLSGPRVRVRVWSSGAFDKGCGGCFSCPQPAPLPRAPRSTRVSGCPNMRDQSWVSSQPIRTRRLPHGIHMHMQHPPKTRHTPESPLGKMGSGNHPHPMLFRASCAPPLLYTSLGERPKMWPAPT